MPASVRVCVVQARNLPVMDKTHNSTDAYVEVRFGRFAKQNTAIQTRTLNPVWQATFDFEVRCCVCVCVCVGYIQISTSSVLDQCVFVLGKNATAPTTTNTQNTTPKQKKKKSNTHIHQSVMAVMAHSNITIRLCVHLTTNTTQRTTQNSTAPQQNLPPLYTLTHTHTRYIYEYPFCSFHFRFSMTASSKTNSYAFE